MSTATPSTSNLKRLAAPALLGLLILAGSSASGRQGSTPTRDPHADLPSTLTLSATVRDFRAKGTAGGHEDFQRYVSGHRIGLVADRLGDDGKPVFLSTSGKTINTQWTDSAGRNISPYFFDVSKGDRTGRASAASGAAINSAASFQAWYRDTAGVNTTTSKMLTLVRTPNTNRYVFDSATQEPWKTRGGYFPINGELFGNSGNNSRGLNSNFHFTSELETTFAYEKGTNQVFTFTGDDDVWVFIDNRLVIDVGGVHGKVEQSVNLDRLNWLENGRRYSLKVFHAERYLVESNFRIETTIKLDPVPRPANTRLQD